MMSMYLSFIHCFTRFNGINRGTPENLNVSFICEDSERISLKHDFLSHCHFTKNH